MEEILSNVILTKLFLEAQVKWHSKLVYRSGRLQNYWL